MYQQLKRDDSFFAVNFCSVYESVLEYNNQLLI